MTNSGFAPSLSWKLERGYRLSGSHERCGCPYQRKSGELLPSVTAYRIPNQNLVRFHNFLLFMRAGTSVVQLCQDSQNHMFRSSHRILGIDVLVDFRLGRNVRYLVLISGYDAN